MKDIGEINKNLVNEIEKQFPKGNQERGKALVLVGVAQMELDKLENTLENKDLELNKIVVDKNIEIKRYKNKIEELEKEIKLLWRGLGVEKI